jgi:hypothetical protein
MPGTGVPFFKGVPPKRRGLYLVEGTIEIRYIPLYTKCKNLQIIAKFVIIYHIPIKSLHNLEFHQGHLGSIGIAGATAAFFN